MASRNLSDRGGDKEVAANPSSPLLRASDVANLLACCVHSVRRYVKRGVLPAVRINSRIIRFRREDVDRLIASSIVAGTATQGSPSNVAPLRRIPTNDRAA